MEKIPIIGKKLMCSKCEAAGGCSKLHGKEQSHKCACGEEQESHPALYFDRLSNETMLFIIMSVLGIIFTSAEFLNSKPFHLIFSRDFMEPEGFLGISSILIGLAGYLILLLLSFFRESSRLTSALHTSLVFSIFSLSVLPFLFSSLTAIGDPANGFYEDFICTTHCVLVILNSLLLILVLKNSGGKS